MNHLVIESPLEQKENAAARKDVRVPLVLVAWAGMLLLSKLPLVIARDLLKTDIPWIVPAWLGFALLLYALGWVWGPMKPLRMFFLSMGLVLLIGFVINPFLFQSATWQNLFGAAPTIVNLFVTRIVFILETLLVLGGLSQWGLKRKELFLVRGDLNAPVKAIFLAGRGAWLRWTVFGTAMILLIAGAFTFYMDRTYAHASLTNALPWLPLIVLAAVGNAFYEEGLFRAAPLALLQPAVGPIQALLITSVWFGFSHFYGGIPSGYAGLVMSGMGGLLMGRAMLDTRGMGWPMIIHILFDSIIFFFMTVMS
jgi:membrane protease YdiL (CAAX protease family)